MGMEYIKLVLGKNWKIILVFSGVALVNLIFDNWIINIIGFFANLMLIGYISLTTSDAMNDKVLDTADTLMGHKNVSK